MQSSASAGVWSVANPEAAVVLLVQVHVQEEHQKQFCLASSDASPGEMNPPAWWWPGNVSLLSHASDPCSADEALVRSCEPPPQWCCH